MIKVKAFTLHEMLIGLVLSGILVSSLYYGVQMMQRYFYLFNSERGVIEQMQALQNRMQQDMTESEWVLAEGNQLIFLQKGQSVVYILADSILRWQAGIVIDRYPFQVKETVMLYRQQEVQPFTISFVDQLSFIVRHHGEKILYSLKKQYAASEQIKIEKQPSEIIALWQDLI